MPVNTVSASTRAFRGGETLQESYAAAPVDLLGSIAARLLTLASVLDSASRAKRSGLEWRTNGRGLPAAARLAASRALRAMLDAVTPMRPPVNILGAEGSSECLQRYGEARPEDARIWATLSPGAEWWALSPWDFGAGR